MFSAVETNDTLVTTDCWRVASTSQQRILLTITANQGELRGCDDDGRAVARCLPDFEHWPCPGATRASIIAAFARLDLRLRPGAALVIYLSGHGGWARFNAQPRSAGPNDWPFFVTADQCSGEEFTSVLAIELSALVERCTRRTANITVIVDACFAPELVRSTLKLKSSGRHAFAPPAWLAGLERSWRARPRTHSLVDERIVCVNAAGAEQPAYETEDCDGRVGGAFTLELCALLEHARARRTSWSQLLSIIDRRLVRRWGEAFQRPVVSGPDTRRMFSLERANLGASVRVSIDGDDQIWLGCGALHGAGVGDQFVAHDDRGFVELEIIERHADRSRACSNAGAPEDGGLAFPTRRVHKLDVELCLARPERDEWARAVADDATLPLRVCPPDREPDLRVTRDARGLMIESDARELLAYSTRTRVLDDLDACARARLFEHNCIAASSWRSEWTLDVVAAGSRSSLPEGGRVEIGARLWVEVANHSMAEVPGLHLNLVEHGLDGRLRVLHAAHHPSGVPIRAGTQRRLLWYREGPHGHRVDWPDSVPRDRARSVRWTFVASPLPLDLRVLTARSIERPSLLGPRRRAFDAPALGLEPITPTAPNSVAPEIVVSVRRFAFVVAP